MFTRCRDIALLMTVFVTLTACTPSKSRSAEFDKQFKVTIDAIERYKVAAGWASPVADFEAEREIDTLKRMANTPAEQNVEEIAFNYLLAVDRERKSPTDRHERALDRSMADVVAVRF